MIPSKPTEMVDDQYWLTATASITIATASATTAVNATTSEAAGTGYPRLGFAHHEPTARRDLDH